ncbi:hypothetical protein A2W24_06490 [Microgenomates group bacterium RBG_16_45_19]|nr:MAG: hypothetical protein A2W24_06490 [Microgenomates group bacterium RBG_16_45_19]
MERYSYLSLTHRLHTSPISVFDLKTLQQILGLRTQSALFPIIKKLTAADIIQEVTPGLYQKTGQDNYFTIANELVKPSYLSFETALNLYGILSQGPQITTSATLGKTQIKSLSLGTFSYTRLSQTFYFGFAKQNNYLIATPEKALLDYIYIYHKLGKPIDLTEWDFEPLDSKKLSGYLDLLKTSPSYSAIIRIIMEQTPCLPPKN